MSDTPTSMNSEQIDKPSSWIEEIPSTRNIIIVGDIHTEKQPKEILMKALPDLRRRGFENLAMEFIPSDKETSEKVQKFLENGENSDEIKKLFPDQAEEFIRIMQIAHSLGMKIVGIDYSQDLKTKTEDELKTTIDNIVTNSKGVNAFVSVLQADVDRNVGQRDLYFKTQLDGLTGKTIVFCGNEHTRNDLPHSFGSLLKDIGFTILIQTPQLVELNKILKTDSGNADLKITV
jgi:hypothetical protein